LDIPGYAGSGVLIIGAVVWIVCAIVAYKRAPSLGRRNWVWAIAALIGGPLALFAMFALPRPSRRK
jgi:multisubunit Na+/H+ antiporter MnhB subunit